MKEYLYAGHAAGEVGRGVAVGHVGDHLQPELLRVELLVERLEEAREIAHGLAQITTSSRRTLSFLASFMAALTTMRVSRISRSRRGRTPSRTSLVTNMTSFGVTAPPNPKFTPCPAEYSRACVRACVRL